MNYFLTGATGFIGRFLLARLAQREGTFYCLVRNGKAADKLAEIGNKLGLDPERLVPIQGDLLKPELGLEAEAIAPLKGQIQHFVHLAAIYDLAASADRQVAANVEGTHHALAAARMLQVGCFHHVSSIAAAGLYRGSFSETMFEEAEQLENPYFLTKHLAEKAVRDQTELNYRIYRPGIVIGDSKTGEAERVDGPYMVFKLLQKLRDNLPKWVPLLGPEGGRLNIVPVDFVTEAMDHLLHQPELDGRCFHLTDPNPLRAGEVINLFAEAAHAPQMALRVNTRLFDVIPRHMVQMALNYPPVKRIGTAVLQEYGLPEAALKLLNYPTRFDCRETQAILSQAGIHCPSLRSYAPTIWDYWERHLDPDLDLNQCLCDKLAGKTVMITGASSGIGLATALKLARCGTKILLVARDHEPLLEATEQAREAGAEAHCYTADLTDEAEVEAMLAQVHEEHGGVDVLINNAGRSIRRSVTDAKDRFHDFERTMAINYFGALRLILGVLGKMEQRRAGHIINISSIGVLTNAPRFSAYVASKSALDAFSRCAASEYSDVGIRFTTINMPLVNTPMIAPTKIYQEVPTLTPDQAADMVLKAVLHQPKRVATRLGIFGAVLHAMTPKFAEIIMNASYRMFPDSASKGDGQAPALSKRQEQISFAALMRGIYF
ncbi:SDR family oxidoreductase [Ferrimonas marina]|uniref:Short-chain dehydrogenase n=1 Tax=Ferrimonas marina TaxID=299255 RepID=A0A1M5ZTG6_9GAMM|nr:SDR family oxidoreductase [Ferrimonas marina]SHI27531.1 Short-chain dehydrogenase [Ferrimonas marina]